MPKRARWSPAVLVGLGVLVAGCAGVRLEAGRYVVSAKGYRVGAPAGWTRVESSADVALKRTAPGGGLMAQASCEVPAPGRPVPILTRHLRFGLRDVSDLVETPVTLDGLSGAASLFRATLDGVPIAVRAVTLVGHGCVYDMVAVAAPEHADAILPAFEEFTQGFGRLGGAR